MRDVEDIVEDVKKRLDQYHLVVQKDGDQGDSAYRSGIFSFLLTVLDHRFAKAYYSNMTYKLQTGHDNAVFRRTAEPTHWGYNSNNFSRDQASGVMLASCARGDDLLVSRFYQNRRRTLLVSQGVPYAKWLEPFRKLVGFHQNVAPGTGYPPEYRKIPDLTGIMEAANVVRMRRSWVYYPYLLLTDLSLLTGLYSRIKQTWDFDSLYAKDLIYANTSMPTPWSLLARILYSRTDYIERIRNNYADSNNGNEPLGELYEVACRKFINREEV